MNLEIFENNGFKIRGGMVNGEPFFVAKDICDALGLENTSQAITNAKNRLATFMSDEELKGIISNDILETNGGKQQVIIINEQLLYELIFASRKQEAIRFRAWVTSEVLPTIRKTGSYSLKQDSYLIEDPITRAKRWIEEQEEKQLALAKIEEQKPKVEFAEQIEHSVNSINIGTYAKMLSKEHSIKIGQNKLFKWLRENEYLIKSGRRKNNPTQKALKKEYFELKTSTVIVPTGIREVHTTLITGKGQLALSKAIVDHFKE